MLNIAIFDYFSRVSTYNCTSGYILYYNRTYSNYGPFSNVYIPRNNDIRTKPDKIIYYNLLPSICCPVWNLISVVIIVTTKHNLHISARVKIVAYFYPPPSQLP